MITLVVIGILVVAVLIIWAFASMGDAKEIDREEEREVRSETPQERERARLREAADEAQYAEKDLEMQWHEQSDTGSGSESL